MLCAARFMYVGLSLSCSLPLSVGGDFMLAGMMVRIVYVHRARLFTQHTRISYVRAPSTLQSG